MIRNCGITVADIASAHNIFGPNLTFIRGEMVWKLYEPVLINYVEVPWKILDLNNNVTIAADIFFVSGLNVLVSVSTDTKFTVAGCFTLNNQADLTRSMLKIFKLYRGKYFMATVACMDSEFEWLSSDSNRV